MENKSFGNRRKAENSKNVNRGNFIALNSFKILSVLKFVLFGYEMEMTAETFESGLIQFFLMIRMSD